MNEHKERLWKARVREYRLNSSLKSWQKDLRAGLKLGENNRDTHA
jgi:hypothetical protein